MGTLVSFDTFFLILALLECIFRVMAYKQRSRIYPTFQKRVVPKMEFIDICVVLVIIVALIAYEISPAGDGGRFHRLVLATRGLRMFRFFPAIVRFRSADHCLLLKREQSGKKLLKNDWLKSLFNFEMRIDINYDKKRLQSKSSKGPIMRLANTFVQCFYFALRQVFLIGLVIYIFACLFQSVLFWVPCTTYGDFSGTDKMLKETYFPGECERNTVDFGYLNVSLVFRDFGRTIVSIGVAFFMKDPQEIFAYVIQLADQPKYDEIANKRLIFALFFSYYITMILFIFNFVTAEIMQLSDLLRYNMLHQVEIDFLKPNNSNFVYCIEWKLNVTSRRGAMIIEYYTKRLNDASDERLDDSDEESYSTSDENENSGAEGGIEADTHWERGESMGSRNSVGSPCRESRFMKRSTIGGKTVTVTKQIKRSGTSWVKERAEDEDGVELQEVRLTDNPLNNASPSMRSRLSTGGSSSVGVRNQGEAKATQLSRSSSRARRQSTLELLPTLVKSRKLPHGEVWVDPRRQRSSSKNRPSLQSMSVDERARYEEKKARTYAKQYSGIPYPPSEAYPDHLKGEWEKNLKFVSGEG